MKKIITFCTMLVIGVGTQAQVKDISVNLQPTASYNWFDDNTTIEDGVMVGGRLGFGFGEALELRAIYEKSLDLKNSADDLGLSNDVINDFDNRDVEIERIGGEFKANIPTRGTFVPYVTLGAGVQKLDVTAETGDSGSTNLESEQIYANLGLGTQVKIARRLFLNLEVKNTVFNMKPSSVLFQPEDNNGMVPSNENKTMYNWSALAGLQFYLGGRSPEEYSELDKAYYDKFTRGTSGFKLIVEPAGAYVNFDNDANLNDSYFVGGKVGFDLNEYIGLRAYYFQATKDEEISTDWDDMAMYGVDFTANLNVARGLVPYVILGGGYLNAYDSYIGSNGITGASSSYFAKGGLGLNVPISRSFEVFGDANLMYTSERETDDLENTVNPNELMQHTMYSVGLRIKLGNKEDRTDQVLQSKIDQRVEDRTQEYQRRIDSLQVELTDAYENNNSRKAVEIIEEKKDLEQKKDEARLEAQSIPKSAYEYDDKKSKVEMTPQELENLVDKVIKGVDDEANKAETTEERIDRLERLLLEVNSTRYQQDYAPQNRAYGRDQNDMNRGQNQNLDREQSERALNDASNKILEKLDALENKIERNEDKINGIGLLNLGKGGDKTTVIAPGQQRAPAPALGNNRTQTIIKDEDGNVQTVEGTTQDSGVATGYVVNHGMSVFTGVAFADEASAIIGIRGNYDFTSSAFKFMPELYVAPGSDTGFGINANFIAPFNIDAGIFLQPYVGLGLGYNDVGNESTFSPNLLVGTSFNVLGGKLFADYTIHNFIDINQLSVGYKFNF